MNATKKIDDLLSFLGEEKSQDEAASVQYKIQYFPIHGRAGPLRLALYLQDIPFEDDFIAPPAFKELQKDYKELAWWGLPQISILDSKTNEQLDRVGQSGAILRYFARLGSVDNVKGGGQDTFSLYPVTNAMQCFKIDEICDAIEDLSNSFGPTMRLKDEKEKETKRKELWETRWSILFDKFEAKLAQNVKAKHRFIVGNHLTIADIKLVGVLNHFTSGVIDYIDTSFIDQDRYKHIKMYKEHITNIEKIKQFYQEFDKRKNEYMAAAKQKEASK